MADVQLDLPLIPSGFGSYYGTLTTEVKYVDIPAPTGTATLAAMEVIDESILYFPMVASEYVAYRPTVRLGDGGGPPEPRYIDIPAPVGTATMEAVQVLALYAIDLPAPTGTATVQAPYVFPWSTASMVPSARETRGRWPDALSGFDDLVSNSVMTWGRWTDEPLFGQAVGRLLLNVELGRTDLDVRHERLTMDVEQGGSR